MYIVALLKTLEFLYALVSCEPLLQVQTYHCVHLSLLNAYACATATAAAAAVLVYMLRVLWSHVPGTPKRGA